MKLRTSAKDSKWRNAIKVSGGNKKKKGVTHARTS